MNYSTRLLLLFLTLFACVFAIRENGNERIRQHVNASYSGIELRIWSEYENAYSQLPEHHMLVTRNGTVIAKSRFAIGFGEIGPLVVDDTSQPGQIRITSSKTGELLLVGDIESGRFQRKWW